MVLSMKEQKDLQAKMIMELAGDPSFTLETTVSTILEIVGNLQLALRHPANVGPTAKHVRRIVDLITAEVATKYPWTAKAMALGNDATNDVPRKSGFKVHPVCQQDFQRAEGVIELQVIEARLRVFDNCWAECAELGHCDGWGGSEYARIRAQWFQAGYPIDRLDVFIRHNANRPVQETSPGDNAKGKGPQEPPGDGGYFKSF